MAGATFTMNELDPIAFKDSIFLANADMIAPVVIRKDEIHFLIEAHDLPRQHSQTWASYAGPAGVGQYSLDHGPTGALARWDVKFRHPHTDEMMKDFNDFGEQVLGPSVKEAAANHESEKYKNNVTFRPFYGWASENNDEFYFIGLPRIVNSVFMTRVFPGGLPSDIAALVAEVNAAAEKRNSETTLDKSYGECLVPQPGYHLFHAENGNIRYCAFDKPESYSPANLTPFGRVKYLRPRVRGIADEKLLYFPRGITIPTDFTEALHRS